MNSLSDRLDSNQEMAYTPEQFSIEVEFYSNRNKMTLLESLASLIEKYDIDVLNVKKLISPALKEKIALESGIKKVSSAQLPL